MRFPADAPDPFAQRQQELLLLDTAALLLDDDTHQASHRADIRALLLRMLTPPPLAAHRADNAALALERVFEGQVAELETHCHVSAAALLSVFSFWSRCDYFTAMMEARKGKE